MREGQRLWQAPDKLKLRGKRDRALLALLLACGLRRHEAVTLTLDHLQQREDHWAIVDLVGKAGHVRTIPVPGWVKCELQEWLNAAAIDRIISFEACSAFTRVTTCRLAESPHATLYTGGSGGFVTTAAPIASTGWSDPVPGRVFPRAVDQCLFTAHCNPI